MPDPSEPHPRSATGAIVVDAGATRLTLAVGDDGRLHQTGFGPAASVAEPTFPTALYPLAHPTFGEEPLRDPALRVTHADGVTSTRLRVVDHTARAHDHGVLHRLELRDRVAPFAVALCWRTWPDEDVLEQWVEIANGADAPVTVHRACASAPAFAGAAPHLTHWGGGWAGEWTPTTEALTPGTKTVASSGGVRSSLYRAPVVLVSPDGPPEEDRGHVGACTVAWGGDVRFDAERFLHGHCRLLAGHLDTGAERVLDPGDRFETPHVLWTWSDAGTGPTSRALHRHVRRHVVRDGARTRSTVVNTWEAVGFDFDEQGLRLQVDHAADLGAELFLLDDGWFGTRWPRDDDTTALGDWEVDRRKLPGGLEPLIAHTLDRGLRFGLWVEPEMVNPRAALYEAHPDWVVAEPGRDRREERSQLVLDLCRPEVAAFVVDTLDRLLSAHPGISYLKWDANRDLTEPGSTALAPDRQTHLAVDRVRATWTVMEEVGRRHPDVELMACASGGGRSDLGTLARCHELWTSDDTDPVDRVRIQWGASHLLPASVLGAHVTRWGQRPVAFGCAVAMSGRFGFDLDLRALDPEERAACAAAVVAYGRIRDLVQHGALHRLVAPTDDRAALAYLDPAGDRAVVFAYRLPPVDGDGSGSAGPGTQRAEHPDRLRLPWLEPGESCDAVDLTPGGPGGAVDVDRGSLPWPEGEAPSARVVEVRRVR